MGINKGNIRYVIHYHLALQLESYLQEIGRAGRDGKPSLAVLLYAPGDEQLSYQLAEMELPDAFQIERLFALMEEKRVHVNDLEKNAAFLAVSCGFSETQWRIAVNFIKSAEHDSPERLKEQLKLFTERRLGIKKAQIEKMVAYIVRDECKRAFILNHFKEQRALEREECCSSCGFDYGRFRKQCGDIKYSPIKYDWEKELASMLLTKAGESNE
jgi:ATP-dependent DNA helicase RecQ